MAKFCGNCGAQMDDNLMFCGNCGARAGGQPAAPVNQAAPTPAVAPAPAATPFANIDYKGVLTGKTDEKTNWIVALGLQVLAIIMFLLPIFGTKIKIGSEKEVENWNLLSDNYKDSGFRAFPTVLLILAIAAVIYMLLPIIQKKAFNPVAPVVMLVAQAGLYLGTVFYGFSIHEKEKIEDFTMRTGLNAGGWIYVVIGAVALFAVGRIVYNNRKQLI